jgi:hypothetical protein
MFAFEQEGIIIGPVQKSFPFSFGCHGDGLHHFNTKGLDNGPVFHGIFEFVYTSLVKKYQGITV